MQLSWFAWRLMHRELPTHNRAQSIGIHLASRCILCHSNMETDSHLFFHCGFAVAIWKWLLSELGIRFQLLWPLGSWLQQWALPTVLAFRLLSINVSFPANNSVSFESLNPIGQEKTSFTISSHHKVLLPCGPAGLSYLLRLHPYWTSRIRFKGGSHLSIFFTLVTTLSCMLPHS